MRKLSTVVVDAELNMAIAFNTQVAGLHTALAFDQHTVIKGHATKQKENL